MHKVDRIDVRGHEGGLVMVAVGDVVEVACAGHVAGAGAGSVAVVTH